MRRYDLERAVLAAELPGPSVALMLALCTRIYADLGIIPPANQPSLNRLAADVGYDRSTVMRHLTLLERAGWLTRIRPPVHLARTLHATTNYAMHVPRGYAQARGRLPRGLGALTGEARRMAEQALAAQAEEARCAALGELGDGGAAARGSTPHKPENPDSRQQQRPMCDHGVPGGDEINPKTNRARCPLCRAEDAEREW
jgi:hypothetical protein